MYSSRGGQNVGGTECYYVATVCQHIQIAAARESGRAAGSKGDHVIGNIGSYPDKLGRQSIDSDHGITRDEVVILRRDKVLEQRDGHGLGVQTDAVRYLVGDRL